MIPPCYGIDLGTTCSTIGCVVQGEPRLIAVDGSVLLPSVVSVPDGAEPLVGQPALNRLPLDPQRTVRSAKRHMGTEHTWDIDGRAVAPPQVAAMVIGRLLDAAEAEHGARPTRAVITVPAWFTQAQRADTRRAGEAAGLTVERIINEPTAAALAHAQGQELRRRVMVYDLGGGTFDVSIVQQDGPLLEVLASHGDSRLGGDDIDEALTAHVLSRLADEQPTVHAAIVDAAAARVRLQAAVEEAKIALSSERATVLRAPFLTDGPGGSVHVELKLTREELTRITAPLLMRTLDSVGETLTAAGLTGADIDELLLVGGATQMPMVFTLLHEHFGLEGSHTIPPRRAVALGAAIQGAIVDGSRVHGVLVDVAPYSLSVGVADGNPLIGRFFCRVLTPRNTALPSRHTELFSTGHPQQPGIKLPIFQGAHSSPRRNTLLGIIEIHDLPPAPPDRFTRPIAVEFRQDLDGMVSVTVTDELSGQTGSARLAIDGEAAAGLHEDLETLLEGFAFDEDEDTADGAEPVAEEVPVLSGDLEEAKQTFASVLAAVDRLRAEHPDDAQRLLDCARVGQESLSSDPDRVLAHYDTLSDLMFETGIFL